MANFDGNTLLKISNSEDFVKFLHNCVDDLISKKQEIFDSYSNDIEWTKQEYEVARRFIQDIYLTNAMSDNENVELKIANLGEQAERTVNNCYSIRKYEIAQYLLRQSLIKKGHLLVDNIDWKLKWVIGSSKLASICEPILQVDLNCSKDGLDGVKIVNFEINLEQVEKLILDLEELKNDLK